MTTINWVNKHLDFAVKKFCEDRDIEDFKQGLQAVVTRLEISPLELNGEERQG